MIISASRRTDIPAFYSGWFFNRIKEGFVLVPNPFNSKALSSISLSPDVVDCIVFWTKNPAPMISKLDRLNEYKYYFQFTLNPYGKDIEVNLPAVSKTIDIFKRLADRIGKERVIWRYDPLFLNSKYNIEFHKEAFYKIADELKDHTERCMLGFIDHYHHIRTILNRAEIKPLTREEIDEMALSFKQSADEHRLRLDTCTIKVDLSAFGIPAGMCIDKEQVERIAGYPISAGKDKNQRDVCRCIESIDIGTYETCLNGCIYCYAIKGSDDNVRQNQQAHDKNSPLLLGYIEEDSIIKKREMRSLRDDQLLLF